MKLDVHGMTCGHCVKAITAAIAALDRDARVQVDLAAGQVEIDGRVDAAQAIAALVAEGYPATLAGSDSGAASHSDSDSARPVSGACS